ncbi:glycosyltransferase [Lithospermum erythrorhizon]|uniref:Glycosyltransferase n=1 Tax=Lithospermum erythrorhizon TaxID=34254 RepID=A0AAV3PLB4_LITER
MAPQDASYNHNLKSHIVAMPRPDVLISFIITEEWHGFIGSDPKPSNIEYRTIPNVIPSEMGRGKDFAGFYEVCSTKLEVPVEQLLDRLEKPKPSVIIFDTYMSWVVRLGSRKSIRVASFFPQSALMFSLYFHYALLVLNGHANVDVSGKGDELVDYIPGVGPINIRDLPTPINGRGQEVMHRVQEAFSMIPKSQFLLLTSVHELECEIIDALAKILPIPIYSIGPAIPYFNVNNKNGNNKDSPLYLKWLNAQPKDSVLYISQGSFLSTSNAQLEEIIAGVHLSGVRFFWVSLDEASLFQNGSHISNGVVVPWCDQLMVLAHEAIGGFWSHCGWNSTKECVFSGHPMVCFPLVWDQQNNCKQIVEDWKIGLKVKKDDESLVTRDEIAKLVNRFMDLESEQGREMRQRAKQLQEICRRDIGREGSSQINIDAFVKDITSHNS